IHRDPHDVRQFPEVGGHLRQQETVGRHSDPPENSGVSSGPKEGAYVLVEKGFSPENPQLIAPRDARKMSERFDERLQVGQIRIPQEWRTRRAMSTAKVARVRQEELDRREADPVR